MGLFETANRIAVLLGGLSPDWTRQTDTAVLAGESFPLPTSDSGVALGSAIVAGLRVIVRETAAYRSARLTVTFVEGETYTVTIDGTDVDYDSTGDADEADVLIGIAAAINADGTVGPLVVAQAQAANGTTNGVKTQVLIRGQGEADFSIAETTTGAADMEIIADAASMTADLWANAGGDETAWLLVNGTDALAIDSRGLYETLDSLGPLQRLYVQAKEIAAVTDDGATIKYRPAIAIGPCKVS